MILRYSIINLVGLTFLFVLFTQGYLKKAITADITNMVIIILFLFAIGFVVSAYRTLWVRKELNYAYAKKINSTSLSNEFLQKSKKLDASSRNNLAVSLRIKIASKIKNTGSKNSHFESY